MKRPRLGELLLRRGIIDELQLQSALAHHRQWGMPLGAAAVAKGFCTPAEVLAALAEQTGLAVTDLVATPPDPTLASLVGRKVAERHRVVPLRLEGRRQEVLVVAMAAPASLAGLDEVQAVSGKQGVRALLAGDAELEQAIGRLYRGEGPPAPSPSPLEEKPTPGQPRPVLLYGWTEKAGHSLTLMLAAEGVPAKVCGAVEALGCAEEDVLVAPLPAMEVLVSGGARFSGKLIVAGKRPEADVVRAQAMGAKGFIAAPVDAALLVRSVKRCRQFPLV
ncbi:MAG: hypothetical protein ACOZIN_18845 [Myxococcota bacterium]